MGQRTFHVVCRDCPNEHLIESRDEAESTARTHAEDTGHATDFERIR